MNIRKATTADRRGILALLMPVIRDGTTYALDTEMGEDAALDYWMAPDKETFVWEEEDGILGTYYLRANQLGGGRHVCNCGYIVSTAASGRGIARRMCEHSIQYAREHGYRAMQFNFVISTNDRAVKLWRKLGFEIVGRLPGAFRHPAAGDVDAFVMYRTL